MKAHKECYGKMFHDTLHFRTNEEMKGKVFSFEIDTLGFGRSDRIVKPDISEWDDCVDCQDFNQCYRLCMAKVTLESAIRQD